MSKQAVAALDVAHAADPKGTAALFDKEPAYKELRASGSLAALLASRNETAEGEAVCPTKGG
jgi:hypothetical protein